jgi:hypothetical protein
MEYEHGDGDRTRATESQFYLPEGVITAFDASRVRRIWTTLVGHYAGPPQ